MYTCVCTCVWVGECSVCTCVCMCARVYMRVCRWGVCACVRASGRVCVQAGCTCACVEGSPQHPVPQAPPHSAPGTGPTLAGHPARCGHKGGGSGLAAGGVGRRWLEPADLTPARAGAVLVAPVGLSRTGRAGRAPRAPSGSRCLPRAVLLRVSLSCVSTYCVRLCPHRQAQAAGPVPAPSLASPAVTRGPLPVEPC